VDLWSLVPNGRTASGEEGKRPKIDVGTRQKRSQRERVRASALVYEKGKKRKTRVSEGFGAGEVEMRI
jgi:hypothetical protein